MINDNYIFYMICNRTLYTESKGWYVHVVRDDYNKKPK